MTASCYHCHEPLPSGSPILATIAGEPRAMCCRGCAAVAELIDHSGLAQFYRLRAEPAVRPEDDTRRWDVFDRASIRDAVTELREDGTRELFCAVPGVKCAACSWLIESMLTPLDGMVELSVNAATGRLRAVFRDPLTLSVLLERLDRLGYRPQPLAPEATLTGQRYERDAALRRIIIAGIGMMQVMMYAIALYAGYFEGMDLATRNFFRLFSLIVATPVVFYAGWPFFIGAWRGLRARRPGMDLPVAIAIGAAYTASAWTTFAGGPEVYFDSAVMFVFFLSLARWIEMRLRHRAFELGYGAGDELPQFALRRSGADWEPVALAELLPGDVIRVGAGEIVPVDGALRGEQARVDESLLTGESRPVRKRTGDELIAGSLLVDRNAELTVVRTGRQTLLSAIRRLLERARSTRPAQVALADRLASILVTLILLVATATFLSWLQIDGERAFEVTLAVLVITCPCALSLATPSALSAATARLLHRGILVVSPSSLETLARLDRVVFDKTGTLTTGQMRLTGFQLLGRDVSEAQALAIAASLESGSTHPIASAFAGVSPAADARDVEVEPGMGLTGTIDGRRYRLGRPGYAGTGHASADDAIVLADDDGPIARFQVDEAERPDAFAAIRSLPCAVSLLSGDSERPVRRIAERLGIGDAHWRQTPEKKLAQVAKRQADGETVAMVGDGTNDAPVLAGADVSVALGHGSATASRQADVILLGDHLSAVSELLTTAAVTRRRIRQNLTWALGYNLLAVPAAATGLVPPWLAAIGMSLSSLGVVLNSLRTGPEAHAASPRMRQPLGEMPT